MQNPKRQIAFLSVLALLLYLVPNMVQDIHRIWGHHEHPLELLPQTGKQFQKQSEVCQVCVFEFNVVDQLESSIYTHSLTTEPFLFASKQEDQVQKNTFHYYNLRGPPKV